MVMIHTHTLVARYKRFGAPLRELDRSCCLETEAAPLSKTTQDPHSATEAADT